MVRIVKSAGVVPPRKVASFVRASTPLVALEASFAISSASLSLVPAAFVGARGGRSMRAGVGVVVVVL